MAAEKAAGRGVRTVLEFFQQIGESIRALFSFLWNIVSGLIYMVTIIPKSLGYLAVVWGYAPSVLLGFITAGIIICVVYFIIGR